VAWSCIFYPFKETPMCQPWHSIDANGEQHQTVANVAVHDTEEEGESNLGSGAVSCQLKYVLEEEKLFGRVPNIEDCLNNSENKVLSSNSPTCRIQEILEL